METYKRSDTSGAFPLIFRSFVSTVFCSADQWRTQEFCSGGGVQQIQLKTWDRQNGDLGAVAPQSGVLEAAVIWYKKFHSIQ
jgi:hypothetical protein